MNSRISLTPLNCALNLLLALFCVHLASPLTRGQTRTAPLHLVCFSVQVDPSTAAGPLGLDYELQFTTSFTGEINGELEFATLEIPFDMSSILIWESDLDPGPVFVDFAINLPFIVDANNNNLDDFFDITAPVNNVTVDAAYNNPAMGEWEPAQAVWSRPAGSSEGQLSLSLPNLGLNSVHSFRIITYSGNYEFTRAPGRLDGNINLVSSYDPTDILTGELDLVIADPLTFLWDEGEWHSGLGFDLTYTPFDNFDHLGANYLSLYTVPDGFPWTSAFDFTDWLAVLDGSDSDNDGTPNILDDEIAPPVTPPSLGAIRLPNGIQITVTGTAGASYSLEAANTIDADTWDELQVVVLTTTTATLTLETSLTQQFLRLRAL